MKSLKNDIKGENSKNIENPLSETSKIFFQLKSNYVSCLFMKNFQTKNERETHKRFLVEMETKMRLNFTIEDCHRNNFLGRKILSKKFINYFDISHNY